MGLHTHRRGGAFTERATHDTLISSKRQKTAQDWFPRQGWGYTLRLYINNTTSILPRELFCVPVPARFSGSLLVLSCLVLFCFGLSDFGFGWCMPSPTKTQTFPSEDVMKSLTTTGILHDHDQCGRRRFPQGSSPSS